MTQDRKYAFRACFVDDLQGRVAARFARENLKAGKGRGPHRPGPGLLRGPGQFFQQEFKRRGGEIVAVSYIQTGDQDFTAQISALKGKNPDLIYAPNYYAEDALLAKQLQDLGVKTPILTGDGAQVPELFSIGGERGGGHVFHRPLPPPGRGHAPVGAQVHGGLRGRPIRNNWTPLPPWAATSYFLLAAAIDKAGGSNGPKIAQALAGTKDFPGVTGSITMGPDHNPIKGRGGDQGGPGASLLIRRR